MARIDASGTKGRLRGRIADGIGRSHHLPSASTHPLGATDRSLAMGDDRRVQRGDLIIVEYIYWLEDGATVASSASDGPLAFTVGQGTVMEGLEQLVIGMTVGETRTEWVRPEHAFGLHRLERILEVDRAFLIAADIVPVVGLELKIGRWGEEDHRIQIIDIRGARIKVDFNHRLAGKPILVQVEMLELVRPLGHSHEITPSVKQRDR